MRAYLFNEKKYYYADPGYSGLSIFYGCLEGYSQKGVSFVVERPTGVRDQEGVEIYEGDEIQIMYLGNPLYGVNKSVRIGEVIFDSGCFLIHNITEDYYEYVGAKKVSNCYLKIIGNKHETI